MSKQSSSFTGTEAGVWILTSLKLLLLIAKILVQDSSVGVRLWGVGGNSNKHKSKQAYQLNGAGRLPRVQLFWVLILELKFYVQNFGDEKFDSFPRK